MGYLRHYSFPWWHTACQPSVSSNPSAALQVLLLLPHTPSTQAKKMIQQTTPRIYWFPANSSRTTLLSEKMCFENIIHKEWWIYTRPLHGPVSSKYSRKSIHKFIIVKKQIVGDTFGCPCEPKILKFHEVLGEHLGKMYSLLEGRKAVSIL